MLNNNNELTIVVPQLNRKQAIDLRSSLIETKRKYAPNAKASIQVGKRENFQAIMQRCNRQLKG